MSSRSQVATPNPAKSGSKKSVLQAVKQEVQQLKLIEMNCARIVCKECSLTGPLNRFLAHFD